MRRILIKVKPKIIRLDKYLVKILERISRSEIQKLIKNRQITVNKKPTEASYNLRKDDFLEITFPPPKRIQPEKISLRIIYEDSEILVINKSCYTVMFLNTAVSIIDAIKNIIMLTAKKIGIDFNRRHNES